MVVSKDLKKVTGEIETIFGVNESSKGPQTTISTMTLKMTIREGGTLDGKQRDHCKS